MTLSSTGRMQNDDQGLTGPFMHQSVHKSRVWVTAASENGPNVQA